MKKKGRIIISNRTKIITFKKQESKHILTLNLEKKLKLFLRKNED